MPHTLPQIIVQYGDGRKRGRRNYSRIRQKSFEFFQKGKARRVAENFEDENWFWNNVLQTGPKAYF